MNLEIFALHDKSMQEERGENIQGFPLPGCSVFLPAVQINLPLFIYWQPKLGGGGEERYAKLSKLLTSKAGTVKLQATTFLFCKSFRVHHLDYKIVLLKCPSETTNPSMLCIQVIVT